MPPKNEDLVEFHFPVAGVDVSQAFSKQPARHVGPEKDDYARSTAHGVNVRGFTASENRKRGGSRPGLVKFVDAIPGGTTWIIQELNVIVIVESAAIG